MSFRQSLLGVSAGFQTTPRLSPFSKYSDHKEEEGETMKVSQLMTKNVSVADLETTLEEIATMMRDEDAGAIPVLDGGKVVGIVTDRDIVLRCIAEGRDPVGTTSE